jgi:hypothetical protein
MFCQAENQPGMRFWIDFLARFDQHGRRWLCRVGCGQFFLGDRSMVGHLALDQSIGVRVPVSQPNSQAKTDAAWHPFFVSRACEPL